MRQRVMLAMGFANEPSLILADEPTTALDVTIQAQILDLLRALNADLGTAVILISHDLGVIATICSRVLVMYAGEVVEEGRPEDLLTDPRHPYTWALLHAAPRLDGTARRPAAGDDRGPAARRARLARGLPLPRPLPVRDRGLRGASRVAAGGRRPQRAVLGDAGGRARCIRRRRVPPPRQPRLRSPMRRRRRCCTSHGLVKHFPLPRENFLEQQRVLRAVDGVDLDVFPGETVGLVGESGCGKSTLARLVMRLEEPTAGAHRVRRAGHLARVAGGDPPVAPADADDLPGPVCVVESAHDGGRDPRRSAAPARAGARARPTRARRWRRCSNLVGLPRESAARFPHEFSGGQRQRISIARALAVQPVFVVGDEPISALDVNIQAQIINLMIGLQERLRLTYLFIAHDLAVVRHISDRIVVLYLGRVVETAGAAELFRQPLHPYTVSLISAVPTLDASGGKQRIHLAGEVPSPLNPPSGCHFRTRCPAATERCAAEVPVLAEVASGHRVACHFPGVLTAA